jgi:adenine-specific DNA-methyltransferase
MKENKNKEILVAALREQIVQVMSRSENVRLEPAEVYRMALGKVIEGLLDFSGSRPTRPQSDYPKPMEKSLLREIGPLDPEEVGAVYEYLRGFTLATNSGKDPELTACVKGKRNQGLFYTPDRIVNHIMKRSLDELEIGRPEEYLNVRILDPAVGTGLFLAEALDQLSDRIPAEQTKANTVLKARLEKIREKVRANRSTEGLDAEVDTETALRIHIVEQCLYGVDLDFLAIRIARAVLVKRAVGMKADAAISCTTHIIVGNALMGTGSGAPSALSQEEEDLRHAKAYFGNSYKDRFTETWSSSKGLTHWPLRFPEVFSGSRPGFDAVVGNPPYEILSVKESGLSERRREQGYYRKIHTSCQGKINTYRLMLERGLELLREGGTLGFIVPATLLADSTASKLRRKILEESHIKEAAVIPEKARAFKGVTQAYLVLITRKGGTTESIAPIVWDGRSELPTDSGTLVGRDLIESLGFRIPVLRDEREKALLEALTKFPPLGGNGDVPAVASVHQGEINMTVHRSFLTSRPSNLRLIRGEHVKPFRLVHPSPRGNRLDWVRPDFLSDGPAAEKAVYEQKAKKSSPSRKSARFEVRKRARIVLGRAVNMDSNKRLKAARVQAGAFLGDMTNSVSEISVPSNYLLGLLNSSLLNWRIKLTSTNNYLSAAEVLALPIPRLNTTAGPRSVSTAREIFSKASSGPEKSLAQCVTFLKGALRDAPDRPEVLVSMIEKAGENIQLSLLEKGTDSDPGMIRLLDALVLMLYEAEDYSAVIDT